MRTDTVQRVRITFGVDWPVCFASVLDLGRLWERLLRRAGLPLAYSQGFNPHPRMSFAMALPVGYTSDCEMIDVVLAERLDVEAIRERVAQQAPPGLSIRAVTDLALGEPSPQASMREAEYVVPIREEVSADALNAALSALLARPSVPRNRVRKGETRAYDLRPFIYAAGCEIDPAGGHLLRLRLACGSNGAGRAEEVVDEMGLTAQAGMVRRVRLVWGPGPNTEVEDQP